MALSHYMCHVAIDDHWKIVEKENELTGTAAGEAKFYQNCIIEKSWKICIAGADVRDHFIVCVFLSIVWTYRSRAEESGKIIHRFYLIWI